MIFRPHKHITQNDFDHIKDLVSQKGKLKVIKDLTGRSVETISLIGESSSLADYSARRKAYGEKYKKKIGVQTSISLPVEARKDKPDKPDRPEYPISNIAPALWAINNTLKQILERTPRRGIFG
jgi:hypothetical protein